MNHRKSIKRKITNILLISVFAVLIITSVFAVWNLFSLKDMFDIYSLDMGQTAATDTELAMESMASSHLLDVSVQKAALIEEKFNAIIADVNSISMIAEKIYFEPDSYPDREVLLPIKGSDELAVQLLWSKRLVHDYVMEHKLPNPTHEEQKELNKLGNLQDLLVQVNANNDMISSVYIATKTGWMIQADYISYSKYSGDNNLPDYYEADTREWYINALECKKGEISYSDVFTDIHENKECIVCSKAVYLNGEVVAVVGVGSYLDIVQAAVVNTSIGDTGYAFLVNDKGKIVVSGEKDKNDLNFFDEASDLNNNLELTEIIEKMMSGESDVVKVTLSGREVYMAYAPLNNLGWSFVTVIDVSEVIIPAIENQNRILKLADNVRKHADNIILQVVKGFFVFAIILFCVICRLSFFVADRLSSPIRLLTREVSNTTGDNLDRSIQIRTQDEVEVLANAFNDMKAQIKLYIENLKHVTAERERMYAELFVAKEIQASMLPDSDSMLSVDDRFSVYAITYPAKEVGGDFYDFFMLDDEHLVFVVADVSGKGVPAALFMAMSKTLIVEQLMLGNTLAQTFENVNDILYRNNDNSMFLTAWLGVLNLSTGGLEYVNAGHNRPLWYCAATKEYIWLSELSGFVIAGMQNMKYKQMQMLLNKGDKIFIYSDGVTEQDNECEDMYGEDCLKNFLESNIDLGPKMLCTKLKKELDRYKGRAKQFDDITMMTLEYYGQL